MACHGSRWTHSDFALFCRAATSSSRRKMTTTYARHRSWLAIFRVRFPRRALSHSSVIHRAAAEDVRTLADAHTEGTRMADTSDTKQELELALGSFQEALGLIDATADPGYYGIIMHDIADTQVAFGNLPEAVAAYSDAMTYKLK